jgi:hypothetical protein
VTVGGSNPDGDGKHEAPPPAEPDETVITPAGPVRRDKVRKLKPGETVVRNPDGSYSVVRKSEK